MARWSQGQGTVSGPFGEEGHSICPQPLPLAAQSIPLPTEVPQACLWGSPLQSVPEGWETAELARCPLSPAHAILPLAQEWVRDRERAVDLRGGQEACAPSDSLPHQGQLSCVCHLSLSLRLCSPQEILEEVVRELHKVKEEIIDGECRARWGNHPRAELHRSPVTRAAEH